MPVGQSTAADADQGCCYICTCVNECFNAVFEEVVYCAKDGFQKSSKAYFDELDSGSKTAACIIRPLGIFFTVLGLYLLFMPIIALLKWIPLVGWLLGGVVSLAAFLFALVVGSVLATFVIAIAWIFYRPLLGLLMFTLVGIGVYFIFFFGEAASSGG